ncbi:antitermination regulator [Serinibacter arcticus]|uniref:Antitermination regulator n=1 Tax=Serinibacter arcticus TaxID=1655435 RepID=A0A2U1ZX85_9MICO|nr:GAF and ANTAR domain-containing protein [Serinibacter arcticus]PWD51532.1 antitermination regulator [Serinibacter arcticus]
MSRPEDLTSDPMAQLAASLDGLLTLEETVAAVAQTALELIPGCYSASITVRRASGRLESCAATSDVARNADDLQHPFSEGPCYVLPLEQGIVESGDVARDERWTSWGPKVHEAEGVSSVLSVRLLSARGVQGALNLYAREVDAFGRDAVELAATLGIHAAVAVRAALLAQDLAEAVPSSRLVGQAQGLLMERFSMDPDTAFAVLRRLSQTSNVKVVEIARRMVDERAVRDATVRDAVAQAESEVREG